MSSLPTLDLPEGKIGFAASVLGWYEEPREAFRLELTGQPIMYGEWRPKFAENDNDFDVEIVSVGFPNKNNLGSPHLAHRKKFSAREQEVIKTLIRALFADQGIRAGIAPFSSRTARFLGAVNFMPGWVSNRWAFFT